MLWGFGPKKSPHREELTCDRCLKLKPESM
jgi:hypothetical protein